MKQVGKENCLECNKKRTAPPSQLVNTEFFIEPGRHQAQKPEMHIFFFHSFLLFDALKSLSDVVTLNHSVLTKRMWVPEQIMD